MEAVGAKYKLTAQWVFAGKNPTDQRFVHHYGFPLKKIGPPRSRYSGEIAIFEDTALSNLNAEGLKEVRANLSVVDSRTIGQWHRGAPDHPDRSQTLKHIRAQRNFVGHRRSQDHRQMPHPAQDIRI